MLNADGFSAWVAIALLLILMPLPTIVSKMIVDVQKKKMKKVSKCSVECSTERQALIYCLHRQTAVFNQLPKVSAMMCPKYDALTVRVHLCLRSA